MKASINELSEILQISAGSVRWYLRNAPDLGKINGVKVYDIDLAKSLTAKRRQRRPKADRPKKYLEFPKRDPHISNLPFWEQRLLKGEDPFAGCPQNLVLAIQGATR